MRLACSRFARLLLFLSFAFPLLALGEIQDGSGLNTSVAVDIGGPFGSSTDFGQLNRLDAREAEVMFYAPTDYLFDGVLSLAAHTEMGLAQFEIHEAYIGSTRMIPRSRFRVGQFFLGFGRLNQFHRHDWPFITAPRVQREFFAPEGVLDTGVEYSFLPPLDFYLDLTVGMTNGWIFGHAHNLGTKPITPTHYARLSTYTELPGDGGAQIGLNYVGRNPTDGSRMTMFGLDATAKWRAAQVMQFFVQSELWYRDVAPPATVGKQVGLYVFPQYHLGSNVFLGFRFDYFADLSKKDTFTGENVRSFELGLVPVLTYKPSEFSTLRIAYNHKPQYFGDRYVNTYRFVEVQGTFILGAHPAHDF